MKSFSEQLSEYVGRVGVSDAELARRLGVSRQTVFRWREGLTRRPRRREDVLEIAARLRLSPTEQDALLLAAGFPPERAPAASVPSPEALTHEWQPSKPRLAGKVPLRWLVLAAGLALLLATLAFPDARHDLAERLGLAQGKASEPSLVPGSTLVLISQFSNYSGAQVGYNIAGRLQEALEQEIQSSDLSGIQVVSAAETAADERAAQDLAARRGAALVVWGEYDSGRVVAWVSAPESAAEVPGVQRRWLVSNPEQLSATINADLPQEVRWMTLYLLGRVHLLNGRLDQAEAAFSRALAAPPADPGTVAAVDFFLGLVESKRPQADLNEVIAYYSEALALQPDQTGALNNRGVAYFERRSSGDLERAEADLRRVLFHQPDHPMAQFNLALILARLGPEHLAEALELLEQAERVQWDSAEVQNALCWFLSLSGAPERALPHCDRAVELDDSGNSNDSRALALALLGRSAEAVVEFEAFLDRLQANDPSDYARYAPSRQGWIAALERGENPFDEETLQQLLRE